ncbi:hypothetical protein [Segatella salivae]|uniref:Uncharacterized protein n=1 Tax=Segatella salivae DSM 15606 TaxID=888832 RepID=E6MLQ8_9BACT|nr:hypothetical protein [Segatella salivae]EFV05425.1 hypothetical protein HMPREF9420_0425 [Segatella salivae DSM 15606]
MQNKDFIRRSGLVFVIASILFVLMLQGCRTKYVSVPEYHNVYVTKHDTLTKHDSVYQKEFVDRYVKGDTVFLTKTKVDYRYKNLYKTLYRDSIKTDSVRVPYPVEKKLSRWQGLKMEVGGWAIGVLSVVVLGAIGYIIMWLVRKYR